MKDLQLIANYRDDARYRLSFNQLAQEVFELDFEKWYQMGLWNDRYICYSFVDEGKVVSNVSVNKVSLVVNGEEHPALQIGTVMTHPDYRKQGLASRLMQTVLDTYEKSHKVMYLFPDDDALAFYRKFGFASYQDGKYVLELNPVQQSSGNVRKLDLTSECDRSIFMRLSSERVALSKAFGIEGAEHILTWYGIGMFADDLYYLEDCDTVVICRFVRDLLQVFDVIGKERVNFAAIWQRICREETAKAVFYFTPDFLDSDRSKMSWLPTETIFFRTKILQLPERLAHPLISHA